MCRSTGSRYLSFVVEGEYNCNLSVGTALSAVWARRGPGTFLVVVIPSVIREYSENKEPTVSDLCYREQSERRKRIILPDKECLRIINKKTIKLRSYKNILRQNLSNLRNYQPVSRQSITHKRVNKF